MKLQSYSAMAIGSLPFKEPEKALDLIWKYIPDYPHWPQLPQRGPREHFVYQYLYPLVQLGILEEQSNGKMRVAGNSDGWEEKLTTFYTWFLDGSEKGNLNNFRATRESAAGFYSFLEDIELFGTRRAKALKGQISGPLSVSLYLYDQEGKSAYYNAEVRDVLIKALSLQARWQAKEMAKHGLPAIIFIDDPAVAAVGSSTFVSIQREAVVEIFKEMLAEIRKDAALIGVHSCAGVDWSIFVDAGIDIISFDADQYFESLLVYSKSIKEFLARGGTLAWGGIPTTEAIFNTDKKGLVTAWKRQRERLVKAGIAEQLLNQMVITPSCGAGTLTSQAAEKIYSLNYDFASYLQEIG
ncbi:hypothetical protein MFMK1_001806 [Metallumcola ferriviriculae]|uniref:Methionine synthase n=1 Tax=Metallumcola ferriviriculae TaxID=3039180 RepID=A0AAU0UM26_9FIRM|nr:hypothetical protein MFMK1_001806 [Desulfitibacteraceae bacterium MK1]